MKCRLVVMKWVTIIFLLLCSNWAVVAQEEPIAKEIAYSGFLSDTDGQALNGTIAMTFALYNSAAGEEGLLGFEEKEEIAPAVLRARREGVPIRGPYPPDVVFRKAYGLTDTMVIALYHDQGLIAFKMAAFDEGGNITLGLPFVRTSPDHGTAFDIAGKGKANSKSMTEAIKLVVNLTLAGKNRTEE